MTLAKAIYQATDNFPVEERFGLVNQMRRVAVSVPSNLAEGHTRAGANEFTRFISIAMGSTAELETQALLSAALGYLKAPTKIKERLLSQVEIVSKMLRGLHKSLVTKKSVTSPKPLTPTPWRERNDYELA
ncbi:MAG TPA: four helix bundle protein [Methylomirabilota bacterium]|jgi:four helix bundle protein|nr:four helix bundle protein [Methylomirabilota bacterium]